MSERVTAEQHQEEVCFARCGVCGRMRWISTSVLKTGLAWGCERDGSRIIRQAKSVNFLEKLWLVKWIFWEHVQLNPGEMWYLNPKNVWKIVMMGMRPKLHQGAPNDEQEENDDRQQRKSGGAKAKPAHSNS